MEISLVDLVDATTETIGGELCSCRSGDQSLSDQSVLEDGGSFDLEKFLKSIRYYCYYMNKKNE